METIHHTEVAHVAPFLRAGGEMGMRMRNLDWALTPLGPVGTWSSALQTLVGVMLGSNQPMFLIWGPRRIRLYNDAYMPILGTKHPHGLGRPLFEIWSEVQARVEPLIDRAFGGEPVLVEDFDVAINRYGQLEDTQFSFSYSPVRGAMGDVEGLLGVCVETTDKAKRQRGDEQVAAELAASEERYRSLFDSMSEGFCILEFLPAQGDEPADVRYVAVNPAFKRVTHVENAQGRTLRELFPLQADAWISIYERVVLTRQSIRFQRRTTKLGRTLELFAYPVLARDREIAVVFTDVTERLEAERARDEVHLRLLETNAKLNEVQSDLETRVNNRTAELTKLNSELSDSARFNREIADAIPGLVSFWDTDGRCLFANEAYLNWSGSRRTALVGMTRSEIFHDEIDSAVEACFEDALNGLPGTLDYAAEDATSGLKVLQMHYLPARSANGAIRGVYSMGFDITALKRAQCDLLDSNSSLAISRDQAQSASRAKSEFISNISHEIRTPLNGIMGLAYILRRDPRDALQARRLQTIEAEGTRLLRMLDNVLELADSESGKLMLNEAEFSLDSVFKVALDTASKEAAGKGLGMIHEPGSYQPQLQGDSVRLAQMASHLLSNAVKFTNAGNIQSRVEARTLDHGKVEVRFSVQDTGEGIAQERQAEIFSTFEQADNSTTRRFGGTGLGLTLTKTLAAAMGGTVGLKSVRGEGSLFWFSVQLQGLDT